jgi:hypothetical protein
MHQLIHWRPPARTGRQKHQDLTVHAQKRADTALWRDPCANIQKIPAGSGGLLLDPGDGAKKSLSAMSNRLLLRENGRRPYFAEHSFINWIQSPVRTRTRGKETHIL